MTLDQFLRKYNRCPFCRSYDRQGELCRNCRWRFGTGAASADGKIDKFDPNEEWNRRINKEVTE